VWQQQSLAAMHLALYLFLVAMLPSPPVHAPVHHGCVAQLLVLQHPSDHEHHPELGRVLIPAAVRLDSLCSVQSGKLFLTAEGQSCIAPEKLEIALALLPHACIPTQSSLSISEDFQENPFLGLHLKPHLSKQIIHTDGAQIGQDNKGLFPLGYCDHSYTQYAVITAC
jgi:hypothetical protein